jgi:predicted DNA-binding transcriptional regulator YafY
MSANESVELRLVLSLCDQTTKRRLSLLRQIQNGAAYTARDLCALFPVSRATATRDLAAVRRAIREATP